MRALGPPSKPGCMRDGHRIALRLLCVNDWAHVSRNGHKQQGHVGVVGSIAENKAKS